MKILTVLTYYRPHTSGLTIYAERLVKALARRGHQVTVLTTQYQKDLPREETQDGVRIVRLPVVARVSKGVLAPSMGWVATRMVQQHDAVLLHLPQFDAAGIALRGRLFNRPTVILYHCDILLPPGLFNRFVNTVVDGMNHLAGVFAHKVVAYTEDFAAHSPYLTRFAAKREVIAPNVFIAPASPAAIQAFRARYNSEGRPIIGMATRFAAEKGVEVLLDALPAILARYPQAKVLFAGQYQGVWGEEAYAQALMPRIRQYEHPSPGSGDLPSGALSLSKRDHPSTSSGCLPPGSENLPSGALSLSKRDSSETSSTDGHWQFLGVLSMEEMAAFFPNLNVLVVPSLNSTETFGFVQIEAMINGVPAVASDLPGVRQPVAMTGMGKIIPVGDSAALAAAVLDILDRPQAFRGDPARVAQMFHPDTNAAAFEDLFERCRAALNRKP